MSGIAGLLHLGGQPDAGPRMEAMLDAMAWLGPDDGSLWVGEGTALGRRLRRLTVEDALDRQPLVTAEGDLVLVAAARLDNRQELAGQLAIPLSELAGLANSDLLLRAYRRWGDACVRHLRGDYCFAVWEPRQRRLVLARDPMGHFPLHYHVSRELFAFASRPAALLTLPDIPKHLNRAQCQHFLDERKGRRGSWYAALESVPAGHVLEVTPTGIGSREFWNASQVPRVRYPSAEEYYQAFRALWLEAVGNRLCAFGQTGVMLSGGLDSAAVAATAAHLLNAQGRVLHGFSFRPLPSCEAKLAPGRIADESEYVEALRQRYPNLDVTYTHAEASDLFTDLDRHMRWFDEPVRAPNLTWIGELLARAAERGVRMMLTGQRGNIGLSFAGEGGYLELFLAGRWGTLARDMRAGIRGGQSVTRMVSSELLAPLKAWSRRLAGGERALPGLGVRAVLADTWNRRRHVHDAWDLAAAGHGLAAFDPCRDLRLVEFCLGVPSWIYRQGCQDRLLVRRGLADGLPALVRDRPHRGDQAHDALWRLSQNPQRLSDALECLRGSRLAAELLDPRGLATWDERLRQGPPNLSGTAARDLYRTLFLGQFLLRHETLQGG